MLAKVLGSFRFLSRLDCSKWKKNEIERTTRHDHAFLKWLPRRSHGVTLASPCHPSLYQAWFWAVRLAKEPKKKCPFFPIYAILQSGTLLSPLVKQAIDRIRQSIAGRETILHTRSYTIFNLFAPRFSKIWHLLVCSNWKMWLLFPISIENRHLAAIREGVEKEEEKEKLIKIQRTMSHDAKKTH